MTCLKIFSLCRRVAEECAAHAAVSRYRAMSQANVPADGVPFVRRGAPDRAAWYSASNSGDPNAARSLIRGPFSTRTYHAILPVPQGNLPLQMWRSRARHGVHQKMISPVGSSPLSGVVDGAKRTIKVCSPTYTTTSDAPACFAARITRATSACVIWAGRRGIFRGPYDAPELAALARRCGTSASTGRYLSAKGLFGCSCRQPPRKPRQPGQPNFCTVSLAVFRARRGRGGLSPATRFPPTGRTGANCLGD